jgi:four helix bundle protein
MGVRNYTELETWKRAMDLVESVYSATKHYPKEETYGLTAQTRRSAVSIPSNIAEGQGRGSSRDFVGFLAVARGSLCASGRSRLNYVDEPKLKALLGQSAEVGRLQNGLIRSVAPPLDTE